MKQVFKKLIAILSQDEVWIENCQLKPKYNFEEEVYVERLFLDPSNAIMVQYREVDNVDAPRFTDHTINIFSNPQIKHLLEIAENQPTYDVSITGSGTKGEIIAALERALADIKASDINEYAVEGETLLTEINIED